MDSKLELLTTREFNGHALDCYVEPGQPDKGAFWATREQIGQLLGYKHPRRAIKDIHARNRERLNKFSKTVKLRKYFNGAQNETPFRNEPVATVYNFKGLLEICRYSNQPVANDVIDKLWEIADEIRQHGMYLTDKVAETAAMNPTAFDELLARYVKECKRSQELQERLDSDRAFTNLGHVVLALPGSMTVQAAAHFLAQYGFDVGQNRLYKKCREEGFLCKRKGRQYNQPTQKAIERGLFASEISGGFRPIAMVTPKGLSYLTEKFAGETYPLLVMMEAPEE